MIEYRIEIDEDHSGNFAREISGEALELRWWLGMDAAYDSMAAASWAHITLLNPDGAFSPERRHLAIGARVRIQSIAEGIRRRHFTGVISRIEPDAGAYGEKLARIELADILPWLADSPARLPPQSDVTAGQVIAQLLDNATIRRAPLAGFCLIDVPGFSEIDGIRIFPPQNHPRRLQAGKTRFAYVGDWWRDSTSARAAISEIAASERGRFYIDRAGTAVFLDRHHTLTQTAVAASFADDMAGLRYSYGDQRVNHIALRMRPRQIGAPRSLLWQLKAPQKIDQRSELELTLRLVDERDQPLGLLALDAVEAHFEDADGSGEPRSRGLLAEAVELGTSSLRLRISNRTRHPALLAQLHIIGQALYRRDPLEIVAADGEGMHRYGLKRLSLEAPALSDIATAQAVASYELARRRRPRGTITSLSLQARQQPAAALSLSLFDRIRISEAQTGHRDREYFIVGEAHQAAASGEHEVTWTLEEADSAQFVLLDSSRIDDSAAVLAPY